MAVASTRTLLSLDRFAAVFDGRYDIIGDCWVFNGTILKSGYGQLMYRSIMYRAHRLAYMVSNDIMLEPDELVLHECDNPPCIRPHHLFEGTHYDNKMDSVRKGRHVYGVRVNTCKLTPVQVQEIRVRRANGEKVVPLAAEYRVSPPLISQIAHGNIWSHV